VRRAIALLLLCAFAACSKQAPPPTPGAPVTKAKSKFRKIEETTLDDSADRLSILTLPRGATVASRTGELILDTSAVRAIDADPLSFWMPPPADLPQSITIALPARTRIEKIGIRTDDALPADHVLFERSTDGTTFVPLMTIAARPIPDAQWFDVTPAEATHVRVTMLDRTAPDREVRIRSILARGSELEAPHPGDIAGCWSLNETQAQFQRHGANVTGTIAMRNAPTYLDGGFDGRIDRFNWIRGNDFGYALFAVAPDGRSFSAIEWHEEAIPLFYGESWFGERRPCAALPLASDTREKFLQRSGHVSLYGIRFHDDGTVDRDASAETIAWLVRFAASHPVQLVAHEFRRGDANANRAFAQRELDSLRDELLHAGATNVTFVARGSDAPRQIPDTDTARAIYSTVDVEIRR
jgi:hypothetical protein